MDFTKFIDSRDVAEHLRKIDYRFTAPEAAYLVYQSSRATLEEKFAAWEHIIESYPDCSMERRTNMVRIDSFHAFLHKHIDWQKRQRRDFYAVGNHVYTIHIRFRTGTSDVIWHDSEDGNIQEYDYSNRCFSNITSCFQFLRQELDRYKEGGYEVLRAAVGKCPIDTMEEHLYTSYLYLNADMEVLFIDTIHVSDEDLETATAFEGMAFAFPTPFQRGDILVQHDNVCRGETKFVLDNLPTWGSEKCIEQGLARGHVTEHADRRLQRMIEKGDESYMVAYGYVFTEGGFYFDNFGCARYLKCEYLREPLAGKQRILKPLRLFVKGEIEEELLCRAYHFILTEEELAAKRRSLFWSFAAEILSDLGISKTAKDAVP